MNSRLRRRPEIAELVRSLPGKVTQPGDVAYEQNRAVLFDLADCRPAALVRVSTSARPSRWRSRSASSVGGRSSSESVVHGGSSSGGALAHGVRIALLSRSTLLRV